MRKSFGFVLLIAMAFAGPAKERLDRATVHDVGLNSVSPDNKFEVVKIQKEVVQTETDNSTPGNESHTPGTVTVTHTASKPYGGSTFARIIDDIFQIPITVLQSVARLLTNPFASHKSPETTVSKY